MLTAASPSKRALRSHKKSRNGCQRCKERKVKCDEERPICRPCSRRFGSIEPCVFERAASASRIKTALKAPSSLQVQAPCLHHAMTVQPESNMQRSKFRLFHHYITCIATAMPHFGRSEVNLLWTIDVPQLSFAFDVVLSAILGKAATHLLSYGLQDVDMKLSTQYHLAKTVHQLSTLVSRIDAETAEPVMLVAMFLMSQIRVRAAFMPGDEPYHLPLEYFHLHDGIGVLFLRAQPFLQNSNILAVGIGAPSHQTYPLYEGTLPIRIWQDCLLLLEGTNTEAFNPHTRSIYEGALGYLNALYVALLEGEDGVLIFRLQCAMPSQVPAGFMELLQQQDPRAMAILARLLALMKPCDGVRYFPGCAEYEVKGIASLMPSDWQWAMEWPRQILTANTFSAFGLDDTVSNVAEIDCYQGNI